MGEGLGNVIGALLAPLGVAALVWLAVEIGAGHPAFPLTVALTSLGSSLFVGQPIARAAPHRWFVVPRRLVVVFRRVGAELFDRFLALIGWNTIILRMREPVESPSDIPDLARSLRASAAGHIWGFVLHLGFAVLALISAGLSASLWILAPGLLLHAYPIMLQLINLHRLEPILSARHGSAVR